MIKVTVAIVLCSMLFLALVTAGSADTRIVGGEMVTTHQVINWSMAEAGGRITVTIVREDEANGPCVLEVWAGVLDTHTLEYTPFNVAMQPPNIGQ